MKSDGEGRTNEYRSQTKILRDGCGPRRSSWDRRDPATTSRIVSTCGTGSDESAAACLHIKPYTAYYRVSTRQQGQSWLGLDAQVAEQGGQVIASY
jgi:hypothetical protein